MIYITLVAGFVLAPFMVIGGWARRRSIDFGPFFLYAGILFAFSALVSAVHVPGGTFIHSAVALAPYSYILALEGIAVAVAWVARRRPSWDADTATRFFTAAAIGFAVVCTVVGAQRRPRQLGEPGGSLPCVAGALDAAGAATTDRVMSIDASGTKYWTGRGGVVLVNDPLETIQAVARAYDIRWLVLDARRLRGGRRADPGPRRATGLDRAGGLHGTSRRRRDGAGRRRALQRRVYPVCLEPADTRCAATASVAAR